MPKNILLTGGSGFIGKNINISNILKTINRASVIRFPTHLYQRRIISLPSLKCNK